MKSIDSFCQFFVGLFLFILVQSAFAVTFYLPPVNSDVIGQLQYATAGYLGESLSTVGAQYDVGIGQMAMANPGISPTIGLTPGTYLKIPSQFILPPVPHQGIVINLPEMRLYYYPGDGTVVTYPVGIGRVGKTIPIVRTTVSRKTTNPIWIPPEDIKQFNREQGITLPSVMGPGPDNPLGPYAIYLRIPTFLIHSTIFPDSIGKRASFGCIRMLERDIKEFFPRVDPGTEVYIIDFPSKVGWLNDKLLLESHTPLEERSNLSVANMNGVIEMIENQIPKNKLMLVDWQLVDYLTKDPDGIPHEIGLNIN